MPLLCLVALHCLSVQPRCSGLCWACCALQGCAVLRLLRPTTDCDKPLVCFCCTGNHKTCEPPLPTSAACRDWQPHVQSEATAALRRLAADDPLLLLRCDSLPQLVHLASRQVFRIHGPRELQEAVDALLMTVRGAATAAGCAEQHLWPVWQHHAPTAGPASQLTKTLNLLASAAAAGGMPITPNDPWDRLAARIAVLQAVGRRGSSFSGGGGSAGSHAWARAAAAGAGMPGSTYPPGANVLLAQIEA